MKPLTPQIDRAATLAKRMCDALEEEKPGPEVLILALGMAAAAVANASSKPELMLGLIAQQIEKYKSHGNFGQGKN